jgi:hypothetical protein
MFLRFRLAPRGDLCFFVQLPQGLPRGTHVAAGARPFRSGRGFVHLPGFLTSPTAGFVEATDQGTVVGTIPSDPPTKRRLPAESTSEDTLAQNLRLSCRVLRTDRSAVVRSLSARSGRWPALLSESRTVAGAPGFNQPTPLGPHAYGPYIHPPSLSMFRWNSRQHNHPSETPQRGVL